MYYVILGGRVALSQGPCQTLVSLQYGLYRNIQAVLQSGSIQQPRRAVHPDSSARQADCAQDRYLSDYTDMAAGRVAFTYSCITLHIQTETERSARLLHIPCGLVFRL